MNTAVSDARGVRKESRNKPGGSNHHEWATCALLWIFSSLFVSSLLLASPRLASPRLASPLLGYQPDEPLADLFPSIASRCLFLSCSCSLPISLLPSPFSASSGSLLTLGSRTCSWPPARNRITGRQPASPRVEELYHQPFLFLYLPHTYTRLCVHVRVRLLA